ncbi:sensor histidine kinase [uncultured Clostridium sp.]|uniref:cache domain-containing sensor histidine kinase n=1 Tax=uncultured Clostridium sp. TaxID=59620 RepID=UPI0025CD7242|nr:sensor histidine kinase [uncultured Clostridium sp.]
MKIVKTFKDMKFRHKIMSTYIIVAIIPITIMGLLWYCHTKKTLLEQEKNNIKNYLSQAVSNMDNQLKIYDNLSDYISFNQTISDVVDHNYDSYYDMYNQYTKRLDPMLSSLKYFHSDINRVTIYVNKNTVEHDTTISPASDIENEEWYGLLNGNSNIHWLVSNESHKVFSVRNMPSLQEVSSIGALYIDVDYNKLFESFKNMKDSNYGIFIIDSEGREIFDYSVFDDEKSYMKLTYDDYQNQKNMMDDKYAIVECPSATETWTVVLYKPVSLIYDNVRQMLYGSIMIILFVIFVCFFISSMLAGHMVSDLEKLRENMEHIENGDMKIRVKSTSKDEVGTLVRGFGKMINQINSLIEDVYKSRIIQKDYEMKALQAQINPHFLYNSLSLINWMAIEAGQKQISGITLSLSSFYRTALNKGKNILSVKDEILNMKSYLDIQLMMHDYEFDVDINIDDDILEYKILNLLLQPLIENAIDHGIDLKREGRGKITIIGRLDGKDIVLSVADNGVGMEQEKIDTILTEHSKGYGVRNVNERIKLYYGTQYEIKIESCIGEGTTMTVRIPAQK